MRENASIMIAEDDDGHYSLIERNLFRSGVNNSITRFRDGQGAVDFLERLKDSGNPQSRLPWLMILDVRMPKVDGLEVLRLIKRDPVLKVIPVIIMTTAASREVIAKCHEAGCNVFIVKPVEYGQFVDSMAQIAHFLSIVELPLLSA